MNRYLSPLKLLRTSVFFPVAFLLLLAQVGQAQPDTLNYFKNYFVTGDVAFASVSLRSTGVNGVATGTINMTGVPCTVGAPAHIEQPCSSPGAVQADAVAAYLYWQTEETTPAPSGMNGTFDGTAIVGKVLGNPNNQACWSSGGTGGNPNGAGRGYRADVLRRLPIDPVSGLRRANGPHTITLADSGGNGNGNIVLNNGATLVVVYRIVVPGQPLIAPLRAVVSYDGPYTVNKFSQPMTQTVAGFYQAAASAQAKITPLVGNGQTGYTDTLTVSNGASGSLPANPFRGAIGQRWDSATYPITLGGNAASYFSQISQGDNQTCLTVLSLWTSMNVADQDNDGLLDTWEANGLHLNPGTATQSATFGGCSSFPAEPCVNLPLMNAHVNQQDIFVEIDWLHGIDGHLHIPKFAALDAISQTFAGHNIAVHWDVGNNYQEKNSPYIVKWKDAANNILAKGGDVIEESDLLCPSVHTTECTYDAEQFYSVLSWKRGFLGVKNGYDLIGLASHSDHNRKDIFHYALFAHALAGPFNYSTGQPITDLPNSTSGVADRFGGHLMVTMGLWRYDDPSGCDPKVDCADQTGTDLAQAGTLMHELGHNVGLLHAGLTSNPPCMSNYPSVMNYLYQTRGLTDLAGNEHIDYSNGRYLPMDELHMSEAANSLGNLPYPYRVRFFGPARLGEEGLAKAHCGGSPITDGAMFVRREGFDLATPDWNRNSIPDGPYELDVNFTGVTGDGVGSSGLFKDSNDWIYLNLQQIGASLNVNRLSIDTAAGDLASGDRGGLWDPLESTCRHASLSIL